MELLRVQNSSKANKVIRLFSNENIEDLKKDEELRRKEKNVELTIWCGFSTPIHKVFGFQAYSDFLNKIMGKCIFGIILIANSEQFKLPIKISADNKVDIMPPLAYRSAYDFSAHLINRTDFIFEIDGKNYIEIDLLPESEYLMFFNLVEERPKFDI